MELKLPYGIDANNNLIHISSLTEKDRGKACGLMCPCCKGELIASMGKKNRHHFKHKAQDCNHGLETALHLMVKQILFKEKKMLLPNYSIRYASMMHKKQSITQKDIANIKYFNRVLNNKDENEDLLRYLGAYNHGQNYIVRVTGEEKDSKDIAYCINEKSSNNINLIKMEIQLYVKWLSKNGYIRSHMPKWYWDKYLWYDYFVCKNDGQPYIFDDAKMEYRLDDIVPDLIVYKNNAPLIIEVKATHGVDDEKREKIKRLGISAIELDFSKFHGFDFYNVDEKVLENILFKKGYESIKEWIHNEKAVKILRDYENKLECFYK